MKGGIEPRPILLERSLPFLRCETQSQSLCKPSAPIFTYRSKGDGIKRNVRGIFERVKILQKSENEEWKRDGKPVHLACLGVIGYMPVCPELLFFCC